MRIGIDARELAGRPTGVGRYLLEILGAWAEAGIQERHELVLYGTAPLPAPQPVTIGDLQAGRYPGRIVTLEGRLVNQRGWGAGNVSQQDVTAFKPGKHIPSSDWLPWLDKYFSDEASLSESQFHGGGGE